LTKEQISEELEKKLTSHPKRLAHIFGVRDTALRLGAKYNLDLEVLEIAALLHDITKYYTKNDNVKIIDSYFPETQFIYDEYNDKLLHAFSAYVLAKTKYNVTNGEILNAILNHTVGRPNMSMYEKIIFISDYIEPNRTYDSCIKVRKLVDKSLDLAVFTAINDSIIFYEKANSKIPIIAFEARHFYRKLLEEKND